MKLRRFLLPIGSALLVLLMIGVALGCKKKDDDDVTVTNNKVTALLTTPTGVQKGEVVLLYALSDTDLDIASISVRYSTDGGATFSVTEATEFTGGGSEGKTGLATGPFPGVSHTFIWDTIADLGQSMGTLVVLRVIPSDIEVGFAGQTGNFTVDNSIKPPPAVVIGPISSPQAGDVTVNYTLFDTISFPANITVEHTTDFGATWTLTTEAVGPPSQGTNGLSTAPAPAGAAHIYVWDTLADVGAAMVNARIRITPFDGGSALPGAPDQSNDFQVNNTVNSPPSAFVPDPTPGPAPTGNVTVPYTLIDPDSDRITVAIDFSTNSGGTWAPAAIGSGSQPLTNLTSSPTGIVHIFVWNTLANVGATLRNNCRIRVTPTDGTPGTAGINPNDFIVDNRDTTPPEVTMVTNAATATINQHYVLEFSESMDPTSVVLGANPPATFSVMEDTDTTPGGIFNFFGGTLAWQNQNRRLLYFPTTAFSQDQEIRIVLTSGMTDVGGNGLITGSTVPSDPLSFTATFPTQVFEDRFVPGGIPDCAQYLPQAGTEVWFYDFDTFGVFDNELQSHGMRGSDPTVNAKGRDRIIAEVLYTLNAKYRRNPNTGGPVPGTSWRISFVCSAPPGSPGQDFDRMCIGTDQGNLLGQAFYDPPNQNTDDDCSLGNPKLGTFSGGISGTNSNISPAVGTGDLQYLDGTYSLGSGTPAQDQRHMDINDAIADWGHAVGTVGAHETGHSVGLPHDSSSSLNIMRPTASSSFLSNTNNRFGSGSASIMNSNLGIDP